MLAGQGAVVHSNIPHSDPLFMVRGFAESCAGWLLDLEGNCQSRLEGTQEACGRSSSAVYPCLLISGPRAQRPYQASSRMSYHCPVPHSGQSSQGKETSRPAGAFL